MGSPQKVVVLFLFTSVLKFGFCENDCKLEFESKRQKENFNKKLVLSFTSQGIAGTDISKIRKAALKFISADLYIQHNPNVADGREAMIKAFETTFSGYHVEVTRRTAASDDLVWLHSQYSDPDGFKSVIVDIYRVECDKIKIVEHWDVVQPIDPDLIPANDHPYF